MRWYQGVGLLLLGSLLNGCAMVSLKEQKPIDYIQSKRADVLTQNALSTAAVEVVTVVGLSQKECEAQIDECLQQVQALELPKQDLYLAALSEMWLLKAKQLAKHKPQQQQHYHEALLESARYSYAYLFYGNQSPKERVLESRQAQVVEYYNYAVQQFIGDTFKSYPKEQLQAVAEQGGVQWGKWFIRTDMSRLHLPKSVTWPKNIVVASELKFNGLRNVYQRDGFGAELVAILDDKPMIQDQHAFSETNTAPATLLMHFQGRNLDEVLKTQNIQMQSFDPFEYETVQINQNTVPLAANFTAPYGVWLAESGFAKQSLKTLLGRDGGIERPHVFLMQPYDPDKRVIVMVHGLASSPEAWVNMANEILGDKELRDHYQIWQVYYPTNMPIALNHIALRRIMNETFKHFDAHGSHTASKDVVLIGHSMGGVISRMMVSSDNGALDAWFKESLEIDTIPKNLEALVRFEPMPQVGRVIFIASPHHGTQMAGNKLGRLVSGIVRLPFRTLHTLEQNLTLAFKDNKRALMHLQKDGILVPNSIDNLDEKNRFVMANRNIRMSPNIPYHSIIAKRKDNIALEQSNDGVVPYLSAHLDGAQSEKVIASGHSVQEHPQAILEIRRILHQDLQAHGK